MNPQIKVVAKPEGRVKRWVLKYLFGFYPYENKRDVVVDQPLSLWVKCFVWNIYYAPHRIKRFIRGEV